MIFQELWGEMYNYWSEYDVILLKLRRSAPLKHTHISQVIHHHHHHLRLTSVINVQTQINQVLLHKLIPSPPTPASISYSIISKSSTRWNPRVCHICNAFNAKPTVKFSIGRSTLQVNTARSPDHHSFHSLQSCHILQFYSPRTELLWAAAETSKVTQPNHVRCKAQ